VNWGNSNSNGHDPHAYLKDLMDKLPTWPNSCINKLLPHRWSFN
jgi:hypothetical protein